jgi:hypothetical protein
MRNLISTWMAWIWSSKCLALLCTSTQSSHLKWVSGGCINNPRQPSSRWLMATEKLTVRWTECPVFLTVSSSDALHVTWPLNPADTYYPGLSLTGSRLGRRFIWCWRVCNRLLSVSCLHTVRRTATNPSVHLVLLLSILISLIIG